MSASTRLPTWALLFGALVLAAIYSEAAAAPNFDADGWHTWQVQSDDAAVRCCGIWTRGKLTAGGCNLDTGRSSRACNELAATDEVRIFVRSQAGKVVDIRALSPGCPVESEHEIHELGNVDNADSIAWLQPYMTADDDLGEAAIMAVAAHSGAAAVAALRTLIEDRRLDQDLRERALFWLVAAGSDDAFAYVSALLAEG
jgi:hypothetical protein